MLADQRKFPQARGFRAFAALEFNSPGLVDEADDSSRFALRLGVLIIGKSLAEVLRFSNVQNPIGFTGKDINTRGFGNIPEEIRTETLHQRP